ncbi:MAG TPA: hypothetical protein DIW23_09395 [Anaerolineae bacterium]|nr:hypothetical protein [Anaerolineae bacterium]
MLFTSMTIFRSKNDKDETLSSSLAIINSLIFIFCFMHHLHLYYPAVKWIFAAVMGVVFLGLSFFENSRNQKHQSDIHLVFSVSLLCMIIPMYFDGSSITYGWSAASVAVMWLGFKHSRYVLRVIGWVLAGLVLFRLVSFDFLDREIIYRGLVTINPFFFVGAFSAAAFFLLHRFYLRSSKLESSVRTNWSNAALITSACVLGSAFLIGGLASVSSTALMGIGIYLFCSCAVRKSGVMYVGLTFIAFSVLRLLGIDFEYSLASAKSDVSLYLRFATGAISTMSVLMLSEWTRRRYLDLSFKNWLFPSFAIAGALLLATLVSDELTKSFMAMMWGAMAFGFIVCGFSSREKVYRWIGLSLFLLVLIRLFAYDFANMQVIYKIISFIGLGVVFIVAGFIYNYYSKLLLPEAPKNKLEGLI